MVLKSVAQTHLPQPNLTVRYHAGLDARFMNECIEVMKLGFGMPAFNNDEIIIPSFIAKEYWKMMLMITVPLDVLKRQFQGNGAIVAQV